MNADPLLQLIEGEVARRGFDLVDLRRSGPASRPVFAVRADRPDAGPGEGITTEECAALSRALERLLEEGGHVGASYVLEVSSPGIERPLRFARHWRAAVGRRVRLRAVGVPGRPEVEVVAMLDEDHVEVRLPDGVVRPLALSDVKEATLVVDWTTIGRPKKPA
ncbi:MAG: ribosome maturation factor RimP [Gemmatimonadales bacterium]|nr:ribosome maturation factor RimP [Gemmatimonadales bacterium]